MLFMPPYTTAHGAQSSRLTRLRPPIERPLRRPRFPRKRSKELGESQMFHLNNADISGKQDHKRTGSDEEACVRDVSIRQQGRWSGYSVARAAAPENIPDTAGPARDDARRASFGADIHRAFVQPHRGWRAAPLRGDVTWSGCSGGA